MEDCNASEHDIADACNAFTTLQSLATLHASRGIGASDDDGIQEESESDEVQGEDGHMTRQNEHADEDTDSEYGSREQSDDDDGAQAVDDGLPVHEMAVDSEEGSDDSADECVEMVDTNV